MALVSRCHALDDDVPSTCRRSKPLFPSSSNFVSCPWGGGGRHGLWRAEDEGGGWVLMTRPRGEVTRRRCHGGSEETSPTTRVANVHVYTLIGLAHGAGVRGRGKAEVVWWCRDNTCSLGPVIPRPVGGWRGGPWPAAAVVDRGVVVCRTVSEPAVDAAAAGARVRRCPGPGSTGPRFRDDAGKGLRRMLPRPVDAAEICRCCRASSTFFVYYTYLVRKRGEEEGWRGYPVLGTNHRPVPTARVGT